MDQEKIGEFIAELRKEKNMTQNDLARKLGVTDRAISKWENGRGMPDLSLLIPLCLELGISINELLSGERLNKKKYQAKLEENFIKTIDYTDKKIKKTRKVTKIFLTIILFIIGLLVVVFCIDMYRMKNNKPVLLSTWGIDYTPSIDLSEERIEIAIEEYLVNSHSSDERDEVWFASFRIYLIEEEDKSLYNVYIWAYEQSYYLENDELQSGSASSIPYKFVIEKKGEEYEVVQVRWPSDGVWYAEDMKTLFPFFVRLEMNRVFEDGTAKRLELEVEGKANLYFNQ